LISLFSLVGYEWVIETLPFYGWMLCFFGSVLHVSLLYVGASRFQGTAWSELFRGGMVGLNAALNAVILFHLTGSLWFASLLGGIVAASAFLFVSRNALYHSLLGWANYLLPMSALVNLPGMTIFVLNLLAAPFGYLHPALRPLRIRLYLDLSSGSWTVFGGLIRPVKGFSGLNMGNFIFINPGWEHLLRHEIGHLFSLGALGWVFHYIGGIDEGYVQENYWEAYAEYLAESYNAPGPAGLTMWR
jgi:hypothetical protein